MDNGKTREVIDGLAASARGLIDGAVSQGVTRSTATQVLNQVVENEMRLDELSQNAPPPSDVHDEVYDRFNPKS